MEDHLAGVATVAPPRWEPAAAVEDPWPEVAAVVRYSPEEEAESRRTYLPFFYLPYFYNTPIDCSVAVFQGKKGRNHRQE